MNDKKRIVLVTAIAAAFVIAAVGSASANCIGDVTGTVFVCGETVTESCTFNADMDCGGHGLVVGADGIVINGYNATLGQYFKITGGAADCSGVDETTPSGGVCGILNLGRWDNVVIKNLEIEYFCNGIGLEGIGGDRVVENTIDNCDIHDNGLSAGNSVSHGVHAAYAQNLTVINSTIYNNVGTGASCGGGGNGIFVYGGGGFTDYNLIHNNTLYNNAKAGFWTKYMMDNSSITNNTIWGNGWDTTDTVRGGIVLRCMNSNYNLIAHNNASNNVGEQGGTGAGYGIYIGGRNNTIWNNTAVNNTAIGIYMGRSDGSHYNNVSNNTACDNTIADIGCCGACYGNYGDNNKCSVCLNCGGSNAILCPFSCYPICTCNAAGNPKTEFWPEDVVYVKGTGLQANTNYNLWIQNHPVNEGDTLVGVNDPSGAQEAVTTNATGCFAANFTWSIGPDSLANRSLYHDWDVVADNQGAGTQGTYNAADDEKCSFDVELPQVWNLSINTNQTLCANRTIELSWEGRAYAYDIYISFVFPVDWSDPGKVWWPHWCHEVNASHFGTSDTSWKDITCNLPYSDPIYATPEQRYYKVVNAGEAPGGWGEVVGKYDVHLGSVLAYISVPYQTRKPDIKEVLKYSDWPGTRLENGSFSSGDKVKAYNDDGSVGSWKYLKSTTGDWSGSLDLQANKAFKIETDRTGDNFHAPQANVTLRLFLEG